VSSACRNSGIRVCVLKEPFWSEIVLLNQNLKSVYPFILPLGLHASYDFTISNYQFLLRWFLKHVKWLCLQVVIITVNSLKCYPKE
jgi:hypothetical protein